MSMSCGQIKDRYMPTLYLFKVPPFTLSAHNCAGKHLHSIRNILYDQRLSTGESYSFNDKFLIDKSSFIVHFRNVAYLLDVY